MWRAFAFAFAFAGAGALMVMAFCALIPVSARAVEKARRNEWKSTGSVASISK